MATTNFKGQPVKLIGEFIQVGKVAPDFEPVSYTHLDVYKRQA